MFWHVYVKIPRVASQNPIAKGDFHWILARNCEDTEQLRLFYVCYSVSAHFYVILIINLFVVKCNKKRTNK